jgi:hypothetical protein
MMRDIGELIDSAKSLVSIRDIRLRDESCEEFDSPQWIEDMKKLSKFR